MVLSSWWESWPQLINTRANPLHQLFQPLKSLILNTLSSTSSLAESESISVAMLQHVHVQHVLPDATTAFKSHLSKTAHFQCLALLLYFKNVSTVCRLSAFYEEEGGAEEEIPMFKSYVVDQVLLIPLCVQMQSCSYETNTTVPLSEEQKNASKWICDFSCVQHPSGILCF